MINKSSRNKTMIAMTFFMGLMWSNQSTAALLNGDFSNGFDDWQGETTAGVVNLSNVSNNFSTSANGAKLETSTGSRGSGNKLIELFQNFSVESLNFSSNTLSLSLGIILNLDDATDIFLAQIIDVNDLSHNLDLTIGSSFDITSFAGEDVLLKFSLENNGTPDGSNDNVEISNILISQNGASGSVPEPSSILLIGVAGLMLVKRKHFS